MHCKCLNVIKMVWCALEFHRFASIICKRWFINEGRRALRKQKRNKICWASLLLFFTLCSHSIQILFAFCFINGINKRVSIVAEEKKTTKTTESTFGGLDLFKFQFIDQFHTIYGCRFVLLLWLDYNILILKTNGSEMSALWLGSVWLLYPP